MQIAFIYSRSRLSGRLTKLVTGSYCYHVAFVDAEAGKMYDMHLIRRRREWPHYAPENVILADLPPTARVGREYLEQRLDADENWYGVKDYCLFALRGLFHLFGKSTPNAGGVICSEMVADDLIANGWFVRFDEVPSPADLELAILGRINAIERGALAAI